MLLGSFSKTVVPAFRLGWMLVPDWLCKKVTIAKQATDLHSNAFSQQVLHRFLIDNSLDAHLEKIKEVYGRQRAAMEAALARHCPPGVSYTRPEGGMFLWLTLPASVSAMALFDEAIKEKVASYRAPLLCAPRIQNTLRLSFSCVDEATIEEGQASVPRPRPHALTSRGAKTSDLGRWFYARKLAQPCASRPANSFIGIGLPYR